MDELVEVEEAVADNHRKTTKFGGSEREGERQRPGIHYVMSSMLLVVFFGNDITKLLAVVLRSEFRL